MLLATLLAAFLLTLASLVTSTPVPGSAAEPPPPEGGALQARDTASVKDAMTVLYGKMVALNESVAEFTPGMFETMNAISMLVGLNDLQETLDQTTDYIDQSEPFDKADSISVAVSMLPMIQSVYSSLNTMVDKKWAFDQAIFGFISATPIISMRLEGLQSSTTQFGDVLLSKMDPSIQQMAPAIRKQLDTAFSNAIAALS